MLQSSKSAGVMLQTASSAAMRAYGIARGRHKYVPVGSLFAIHGSQRPGQRRTRTWLPFALITHVCPAVLRSRRRRTNLVAEGGV